MKKMVLLLFGSLMATALLTSSLMSAQTPRIPTIPRPDAAILSGGDLGFRVDSYDPDGRPRGILMVRQDGEWVEAGFSITSRRLH